MLCQCLVGWCLSLHCLTKILPNVRRLWNSQNLVKHVQICIKIVQGRDSEGQRIGEHLFSWLHFRLKQIPQTYQLVFSHTEPYSWLEFSNWHPECCIVFLLQSWFGELTYILSNFLLAADRKWVTFWSGWLPSAMIRHWQDQAEGERLVCPFLWMGWSPSSRQAGAGVQVGTWGRNWSQNHEGSLHRARFRGFLTLLSYTTWPGLAPLRWGWAHPYEPPTKKMKDNQMRQFFSWGSLFPSDSSMCQGDKKLTCTHCKF